MPKLLVVDDEPNIPFSIEQVFEGRDVAVLSATSGEEGLAIFREELPDVVLLDVRLGSRSGLDVFRELRALDAKCLVIFITGHGNSDTAIEAMKLGGYDYLVKPLDAEQLQQVVGQALNISRLMRVPAVVEDEARQECYADRLIGGDPAMQAICKKIGRLAPQDVNVLILGESGTGKELVARAIYHHSLRAGKAFLAINCAAIPESLLETELFGHERGAFTGADRRRIGKFEQCDGGTVFLDEIGDMPPHTQSKILRLLQEKRFERLGGNESITVDVRVVAATNQDLGRMIEQGTFRRDLYYRLRGATLILPPLRERRRDIAELAHYFLFRHNRRLGTAVQSISQEALELMEQYDWPGNVRELENAIREALIASAGPTLLPEFLPADLNESITRGNRHAPIPSPDAFPAAGVEPAADDDLRALLGFVGSDDWAHPTDVYRRARDHFDRLIIQRALRHAEGNQQRASEILGLSRVTLRAKLRSLNLSIERTVTGAIVALPSTTSSNSVG
jgi:two-component system nitrogen regulation response regulator GlnG